VAEKQQVTEFLGPITVSVQSATKLTPVSSSTTVSKILGSEKSRFSTLILYSINEGVPNTNISGALLADTFSFPAAPERAPLVRQLN
jgi:hypothetical protein